ncbi:MAG: type II toxin-antitoxin system RelE/ParE family toxin [Planctomycetota bacterium]|nr:type II toxin-antitoxin system RelE/ParE family toxin [Planctomycetota bacterium]
MWEIEYTDEFGEWWKSLSESEQDELAASIGLLEALGPNLGRPHADHIKTSKHSNMKELRTQVGGEPLRTCFVFDPRRTAILLIGGNKGGDNRFYDRMIPIADRLYDTYLIELRNEGLLP